MYYDSDWKYQIEDEWIFLDPYPYVTMGIPMQDYKWNHEIFTIYGSSTIGNSIIVDTTSVKNDNDSLKFRQKLKVIQEKTKKENQFFHYYVFPSVFNRNLDCDKRD